MTSLMRRRRFLGGAATLLSLATLAPKAALAQLGKATTRLVVGFPPGGSGDLFARIIATPLGVVATKNAIIEGNTTK